MNVRAAEARRAIVELASPARVIGGLGTIAVVTLFGIQLQQTLDKIPGANLGDVLDTGFYVAAIAGVVGLVSGLVPSGWSQRRWTETEVPNDRVDLSRRV